MAEMNEVDRRIEAERLAKMPIVGSVNGVVTPDTDKKVKPVKPVKVLGVIASVFTVLGFKLPNKTTVFKNDDGTETTKLAIVNLKLTQIGISFKAAIYSAIKADAAGRYEEIYMSLPSSGKGFPRPVFEADDPDTQTALDTWRQETVEAYVKWANSLKTVAGATVAAQSTGRIVRRLPAIVQPTV